MYFPGRLALLGLVVSFAVGFGAPPADEPAPLLKPIVPANGQVRARVPVTPGYPKTVQMAVQVPKGTGTPQVSQGTKEVSKGTKMVELIDAVAAVDSLPGPSYITAKKLESWGYAVPKNKEFLLPELLITMAQIAPKSSKEPNKGGSDVVVRLTNIKLNVVESPASTDDTVFFSDLSLSATALYQGNERAIEPRLSFEDKFLEMTVPAAIVKRPGTDTIEAPAVTASSDATLVTAVGPLTIRGGPPVFAYAAINGQESYKRPSGEVVPVNVMVASISNWDTGIVVTIGLARGCKVDMDMVGDVKAATGVQGKSEMLPGKIKELRLGLYTGAGLKVQKDLVIKDIPVVVDKNVSEGYVFLGPKFVETYFKDGVYAAGADGWKMHGRVSPELLFDIKTRKKPEKK